MLTRMNNDFFYMRVITFTALEKAAALMICGLAPTIVIILINYLNHF